MGSIEELAGYDDFSRILKEYKQKCGKLFSNSLLPGKSVREALDTGAVYLYRMENGFLVLTEEGADEPLKCSYFLTPGEPFPKAAGNRAILIEEPDSNGRRQAWLSTFIPVLEQAGFRLAADNVQVSCELTYEVIEKMIRACSARLEEGKYVLRQGAAGFREQIRGLWRAHLKPTDIPPSHWDLSEENGIHIVCAFDGNGVLRGVNWWQEQDHVCEIRHTVTDPSCKRKGIGTGLVLYAMRAACLAGCERAFTYIDRENTNSLGLYGKTGFGLNGRRSLQLLRPPFAD